MLGKKDPALAKMNNSASTKMKLPSDNLVWFKKDVQKELVKKIHCGDKQDERKLKEGRSKDDLRSHISGRGRQNTTKELRYADGKNKSSSKRKSSPGYKDRDRYQSRDKSRKSAGDYSDKSRRSHGSPSRRSDHDHRREHRLSEKMSSRASNRRQTSPERKPRSPDRHRRSDEKLLRSPYKRRSIEKQLSKLKRSSSDRYDRSPRKAEKYPISCKVSSRSSHAPRSDGQKRSRRSSRSDQVDLKKESSHSSRSPQEYAGKSSVKYSYSKDLLSSSKSPKKPVGHSQSSSCSLKEEAPPKPVKNLPHSGDPLSNLNNPSPPPGSLPLDLHLPAPTPVTQSQMPFPASFLTQHPQFPHVFILNTMGSRMGGQMMMPVPMGPQQPLPNQPPTL